jgi:hypothetical protein
MSPPIVNKEVKHEENKVQVQEIAEEMNIIQQDISDEKQALNEMNDEQKQIYKQIRELGRQIQIREENKRLIKEENIYNFPEEILIRIENIHVYSEEEIEQSLNYIRQLAIMNYTEEQLKEISILFEKFTVANKTALFSALIQLQLRHECRIKGAISLYMVFYIFAKIIGLYSIKNIMRLLNNSLEKEKEFKERFNIDFSEFLMLDNRRLPCLNHVLKNMKLKKKLLKN